MPTPAFARGRLFVGMTRWAAFVRQSLGRLALYQSAKLLTCTANVARTFCVMAGKGRPPTTFLCCTRQSRGWPASAGHDTRARGMSPRANDNAGWYYTGAKNGSGGPSPSV